ncbi:sn-glycerol-1-phosphate dehydrogenase [Halalkalibacter kiskunsagensis]|uniref:Sn-glycerol-1-phosphate dehydrogenase n=1 Tax=Halalkalibacter kiskunsagensis TaxID=1548599 RepID=A0ABV6KJ07_9BACI
MNKSFIKFSNQAKQCHCGNRHYELTIDRVEIKKGALEDAVSYVISKQLHHVVIVADEITYKVAGEKLQSLLEAGTIHSTVSIVRVDDQNDVVANETSIGQVLLEVPKQTDVLLAVGSGTIHDITRMVSYKMDKPFISVPTAPSVDGFNSMGAPVVINGVKTTFQTHAPIAVFADMNILVQAPRDMIAAGFGDVLGKVTSLVDWRFGHIIGDEPFCPLVYRMTEDALHTCINNVERISTLTEEGIKILMEALINSGLAMLLFGRSHPASGAEHHLSHYWEMELLRTNRKQILHGAKVGVSTQIIADLYKEFVFAIVDYAKGNKESTNQSLKNKVLENEVEITNLIGQMIDSHQVKEMIDLVGGKTTYEELAIEQPLLEESVKEAHNLRERFTLLYIYNKYVRS